MREILKTFNHLKRYYAGILITCCAGVVGAVVGWARTSLRDTHDGESIDVSLCIWHPVSGCFVRFRTFTSFVQHSLVHCTQRPPSRSDTSDVGGWKLASSKWWPRQHGHETLAVNYTTESSMLHILVPHILTPPGIGRPCFWMSLLTVSLHMYIFACWTAVTCSEQEPFRISTVCRGRHVTCL